MDHSGESGALMGLWDCLRLREGKRLDVDSLFKVLAHLEKTDAISEFDDSGSLLHATIWSSAVDSSEETTTSLRRWMNFLKNEEYDFEGAEHGRTPLLDHLGSCGFASLEMTGLLLEFGVNVHATTPLGRNALQCAIYSSKEEEDREILEQKLCILIKAGVDVDHCDEYGYSPSDYAQEGWFDCWDEWCRALESNGLKIDYVTKADEERRKIYRESRRLEEWWDSAGEWDSAKNAVDVAADHTKKYQEEPPS